MNDLNFKTYEVPYGTKLGVIKIVQQYLAPYLFNVYRAELLEPLGPDCGRRYWYKLNTDPVGLAAAKKISVLNVGGSILQDMENIRKGAAQCQ